MPAHPRNKLNDLTASEWVARTVSVFVQRGLGSKSEEAYFEKLHPAPFSFTDVTRFIEFFTKKNGQVLDPFGGIGSTSKAAALLGRRSTSVEINPYFVELARQRLDKEVPKKGAKKLYEIICDDVRKVALPNARFDLIVTSPPYWGILDKVDHKARQERISNGVMHNYGEVNGDLSKIPDYDKFVNALAEIFTALAEKMRDNAHAVIIVGDFRHKSRFYMFHSDLARKMEEGGRWSLKGVKIMYQKHKRVFPYGYPYSYVPNLHHQYALIFRKNDDE
jgi:DNA modification methylase